MRKIDLFENYENAKLESCEEFARSHTTVGYSELSKSDACGLPVCIKRDDNNELKVTLVPATHSLCIGATRSGKTTGFILPSLKVFQKLKRKPSLVISDPKGELYAQTADGFEKAGYQVILLDFIESSHSDCWNPLTKIFRLYKKYVDIEQEVEVVEIDGELKNSFRGTVYESQSELERALNAVQEAFMDQVENGINSVVEATITEKRELKDPFWNASARDLLRAILYGMLEDSENGIITESNFSFATVIKIFDSFGDDETKSYDRNYFSRRSMTESKALQLAKKCILEQAATTRRCIASEFATKINKFRDTAIRRVTCTNTFEISEFDGDRPVVVFVAFRDEESVGYEIISLFLTNLYTELIALARRSGGRLKRPFYFWLDEFGNLPAFGDFDKVLSACGARNIWFNLVLQSYAQLNNVYGEAVAAIIKDNLNLHIFFGSNNPETVNAFSEECGKKTVISPISALNGKGESIQHYDKDIVPLVPVSRLKRLGIGECVVTQMRENVLWSYFERSYTCKEFFTPEEAEPCKRGKRVDFSLEKYAFDINAVPKAISVKDIFVF